MELRDRELSHVAYYYQQIQDDLLKKMFPFGSLDLGEHLSMYRNSLKANATSYGKVIYVEETYIGDVWCYGIDEVDEKMTMLSIVIFDKSYWSKGIGSAVISEFTQLIFKRYAVVEVGAFTYADNIASRKSLIKAGFTEGEAFVENGVKSYFYSLNKN